VAKKRENEAKILDLYRLKIRLMSFQAIDQDTDVWITLSWDYQWKTERQIFT